MNTVERTTGAIHEVERAQRAMNSVITSSGVRKYRHPVLNLWDMIQGRSIHLLDHEWAQIATSLPKRRGMNAKESLKILLKQVATYRTDVPEKIVESIAYVLEVEPEGLGELTIGELAKIRALQ